MMRSFGRTDFEVAAAAIRDQTRQKPRVGLILGSGLGNLADSVEKADIIPYTHIPGWPLSTVFGHEGQLHLGTLEGMPVMVLRGRAHFYEGYPMQQITLPIRVMQLLGVEVLIVTNAAGGLNQSFKVADLMVIKDHLNMPGMAGNNPLAGPNDPALGTRFPDMSQPYDLELRKMALEIAKENDIPLHEGVYAYVAGPSFETPAEIKFLHRVGGDAVGMSTAPEVVVARHGGMRVLGISGISNVAIIDPVNGQEASHEEVLEAGKVITPRMETIIRGVLRRLA